MKEHEPELNIDAVVKDLNSIIFRLTALRDSLLVHKKLIEACRSGSKTYTEEEFKKKLKEGKL